MKVVRTEKGLVGWQCKLHEVYYCRGEFMQYDEIYDLANRLGFKSALEAWEENPTVQGSVSPKDYHKAS